MNKLRQFRGTLSNLKSFWSLLFIIVIDEKALFKELIPMKLIIKEIYRLIDDYYKCDDSQIKEQLIGDITFLTEAYLAYIESKERFL